MSQAAHLWLRRMIWAMIGIAAFWVVYQFALSYRECRSDGTKEAACAMMAVGTTALEIATHIMVTLTKIISLILP